MLDDIGRFVGRYFQVWACLSIALMFITAIFFDSMSVDFSVIFLFWAAAYLIKHHPTARNWTIGVCVLILVSLGAVFVYAAVAGTDSMTLRLGGAKFKHPSVLSVGVWSSVSAVLVGLPLVLLLTPQARREFQRLAQATVPTKTTNRYHMETHRFVLILSGVSEITPELADALYEAANGEIEFEMRDGVATLEFERASATLREAILSAIRDVEGADAGVRVIRVESDSANTIAKINAELLGVGTSD